jgi:uroporphyrinogen-III decarboxylase
MGHAVYMADGSDRRDSAPCPFATPEEVLAYDPLTEAGEYAPAKLAERFNEHYRQSVDFYPDTVNMSGTYITMFSGFIALFGWEMLLTALGTDPVAFGALAGRYEAWIRQFFEAFANSDVPVMMVHDDIVWTSGPVVAPAWYREYIFPAYKRLIRPVLDAGKKVLFTSDGTYTEFFDDIVQAGFHGLVFEPTSDMALFAERYGKTHAFVGNADTRTLLTGTRDEIRAEVRRCVDIGRDCPGFFMAVGNHIPANTPVDNALFYNEVFQELRERS